MGTWGPGAFDDDAAADFLAEAESSPSRALASALRAVGKTKPGAYLDGDLGRAAWAACELVALAFGRGDEEVDDAALEVAAKLKPKDDQRLVALSILPRLADRATSELAQLWHEGEDGPRFDAAMDKLRERLEAASAGPREQDRPQPGDVLAVSHDEEWIVVQVVGARELAVFEGVYRDDAAALGAVKQAPARRISFEVTKLARRARGLGNVPLRKDLKGRKFHASEALPLCSYLIATASAGGAKFVPYDDARDLDLIRPYGDEDLRAIALGSFRIERVRSPEERIAELVTENAEQWRAIRETTSPGPFGDLDSLRSLVEWIERLGVADAAATLNTLASSRDARDRSRYGPERRGYAFAGLVALWRGTLPRERWPFDRVPEAANENLVRRAIHTARKFAEAVVRPDAELKLIWDGAPDGGAAFRESVAELMRALS